MGASAPMFNLILISVVFALLVGLTVKRVTDWMQSEYEISWNEYAVGSAICALIVVPLVCFVGWKIAVGNMVEYNEWWNGWETKAEVYETKCEKNGSCSYEYDCDPYTVTDTYTDANGNTQTSTRTEWNSCPYVTKEYQYVVRTTLGDYTIGGIRWAENPRLWSGWGDGDRDGLPDVPRGAPKLWEEARDRIAFGDNGPVTKRAKYENFILASQSTILAQYSDSIRRYRKDGLLPKVAQATFDYYQADKVYDLSGENLVGWPEAVARLNAALGTDLQGDLHVVVVPAGLDPDNYSLSLQAYWGSPALGKDALSKNAIVLVMGAQDDTVKWARSFTGMPLGNNAMLAELRESVVDQPLVARSLFGHPTVRFKSGKPVIQHTDGVVENVLWGPNKFERVCMGCEGKGDKGTGYLYLKNELQPGNGARTVTAFIAVLLSSLVWVGALLLGTRSNMMHSRRSRSYYW